MVIVKKVNFKFKTISGMKGEKMEALEFNFDGILDG